MTPAEFRDALKALGLTQRRFALIAKAGPVTVNRWAQGEQAVPGPVIALLREIQEPGAWKVVDNTS
jgi:DNA-binding transcriptional regulator YiaG